MNQRDTLCPCGGILALVTGMLSDVSWLHFVFCSLCLWLTKPRLDPRVILQSNVIGFTNACDVMRRALIFLPDFNHSTDFSEKSYGYMLIDLT